MFGKKKSEIRTGRDLAAERLRGAIHEQQRDSMAKEAQRVSQLEDAVKNVNYPKQEHTSVGEPPRDSTPSVASLLGPRKTIQLDQISAGRPESADEEHNESCLPTTWRKLDSEMVSTMKTRLISEESPLSADKNPRSGEHSIRDNARGQIKTSMAAGTDFEGFADFVRRKDALAIDMNALSDRSHKDETALKNCQARGIKDGGSLSLDIETSLLDLEKGLSQPVYSYDLDFSVDLSSSVAGEVDPERLPILSEAVEEKCLAQLNVTSSYGISHSTGFPGLFYSLLMSLKKHKTVEYGVQVVQIEGDDHKNNNLALFSSPGAVGPAASHCLIRSKEVRAPNSRNEPFHLFRPRILPVGSTLGKIYDRDVECGPFSKWLSPVSSSDQTLVIRESVEHLLANLRQSLELYVAEAQAISRLLKEQKMIPSTSLSGNLKFSRLFFERNQRVLSKAAIPVLTQKASQVDSLVWEYLSDVECLTEQHYKNVPQGECPVELALLHCLARVAKDKRCSLAMLRGMALLDSMLKTGSGIQPTQAPENAAGIQVHIKEQIEESLADFSLEFENSPVRFIESSFFDRWVYSSSIVEVVQVKGEEPFAIGALIDSIIHQFHDLQVKIEILGLSRPDLAALSYDLQQS